MGWEILGSGISIAELVVALVGLGAGGYAGGRAAAIARMRTEDRRTLVESHVANLRRVPQTHELLVDAEQRWMQGFERWIEAEDAAIGLVQLLPWTDRASWARVARQSPRFDIPGAIGSDYAPPPDDPTTQAEWRTYIGLPGGYIEGYEVDIPTLNTFARITGARPEILEWAERLQDFDQHLRRQLRPSFVSRARSTLYRASLVLRGPHRF